MLTAGRAAASDAIPSATGQSNRIVSVPLFLLIQGNGRVVPFTNGQILPAGRECEMNAFPARGYEFAYWSPVDVFTDTEVIYDTNNNPLPPLVSVAISPNPEQIQHRSLKFKTQPAQVIVDIPGIRTLTVSTGWQATFVKKQ